MKFNLSRLTPFAAALGVAALTSGTALAQSSYPNKPIRILVGFAPGGPSDIISRVVGAKMGEIMRWRRKRCGSACRSPSIWWCIAPISNASPR